LARSEGYWSEVQPLKRELAERVSTALGIDAGTPETFLGLIDAYAEARLFRQTMFHRLAEVGGAVTAKGRTRALYTAYLSALDRETKLAITLGLERRQKAAQTLADVLEQHEDVAPTRASAWPVAMQPEPEPELGELMQQAQRETVGLAAGGEHGGKRRLDGSRTDPSNARPTLAEAGIDKHLADAGGPDSGPPVPTRSLADILAEHEEPEIVAPTPSVHVAGGGWANE